MSRVVEFKLGSGQATAMRADAITCITEPGRGDTQVRVHVMGEGAPVCLDRGTSWLEAVRQWKRALGGE